MGEKVQCGCENSLVEMRLLNGAAKGVRTMAIMREKSEETN
jgi:hypothetical protein